MTYSNFDDDYRHDRSYQPQAIVATQNPNSVLECPNYADKLWATPQAIYGRQVDGLEYVYSDRLWSWNREQAEASSQAAKASGAKPRTARWAEVFLQKFYEKPGLRLICILGGCNQVTGYEYYVYGFKI